MIKMVKLFHDGRIHNPFGGGSSVFTKECANYIANYLPKNEIRISVPAMPNTPPHFGAIVTFSLAFSIAQRLKKLGKDVTVKVGLVDTGSLPADRSSWEDDEYQKSIAYIEAINNYLADFQELLLLNI